MLLPISVEIFPHNNKKEGKNAAAAPWVQGIPNYSANYSTNSITHVYSSLSLGYCHPNKYSHHYRISLPRFLPEVSQHLPSPLLLHATELSDPAHP